MQPQRNTRADSSDTYVYTPELEQRGAELLRLAADRKLRIATAESCTGGALAALLTDVEGLSHVFERGYAVYSDDAKCECLGVPQQLIETKSAVCEDVARAMATGALDGSRADVAVSITGYAGPAGPDDEAGLVYICSAVRGGETLCRELHFGSDSRSQVRMRALDAAIDLLKQAVSSARR